MKTSVLIHLRKVAAAAAICGVVASQALAMPAHFVSPDVPGGTDMVIPVSGDCYAIGMQQASREGGTLAKATPEVRDGRQVCVIVIMLPARDGNRPVVSTTVVPLG